MATVVIMPKQGQSVESCIVSEFLKKKGDSVKKGEILFTYETDKASFEEEAQVDGTVLDVFFSAGDEIPVLTNVLVIGNPGESTEEFDPNKGAGTAAPAATTPKTESPKTDAPVSAAIPAPVIPAGSGNAAENAAIPGEMAVSPRARALAAKEAVNLATVAGTGPHGRVIERDVQAVIDGRPKMTPLAKEIARQTGGAPESGSGLAGRAVAADITAPKNPVYGSDSEVKPLTNMRKLIAKAMHHSLQSSAQLTHHLSADARRMTELRKTVKAAMDKGYPTNITLNDMVCYAVIRALKKFPNANSHFLGLDEGMRLFNKVHLGLAVDTERGLMVPVCRNADDLSIAGLSNQLKELAAACKKGNIDPDLLASEAGSFTVSNLGNYGVEIFTPIVNVPQSAILGVNTIVPRPKDLGDGVYGFVPHIGLSLTYDHRALDGGEATRFVKQVAVEIENLEFEL